MKGDLFAAYIDIATGDDLKLALAFMEEFDSVRRPVSVPAILRKANHSDPQIRATSFRILAQLSEYSRADRRAIKDALDQAVLSEKDGAALRAAEGARNHVLNFEKSWEEELRRQK
jgi:hypothetical protein